VPDGWTISEPTNQGDVVLIASPANRSGEETVRRAQSTEPILDVVSAYIDLFRFEQPRGAVLVSRMVTVSGAAQAWLLETTYQARPKSGSNAVKLWALDVFMHSSSGEDLHLILVSEDQRVVEDTLPQVPNLLQLGHQTTPPATP
jgi:hypothetical protein